VKIVAASPSSLASGLGEGEGDGTPVVPCKRLISKIVARVIGGVAESYEVSAPVGAIGSFTGVICAWVGATNS
jgi:hypothetical protein